MEVHLNIYKMQTDRLFLLYGREMGRFYFWTDILLASIFYSQYILHADHLSFKILIWEMG